MAGMLDNKKALIVGLASNRSIAAGIAQAFHQQGASLAFTYQNDRLKSRVEEMARQFNSNLTFPCDVSSDAEIEQVFTDLKTQWNNIDIIVHSVAFAPGDQLAGDYLECVHREGFNMAHEISSYSFAALAKAAQPMLSKEGSLLTLSYLGAEKAFPNYNVMGLAKASLEANVRYMAASLGPKNIRVNGISAGPIRTLAAAGITGFKEMVKAHEQVAPLRRTATIEEVGDTAAFLCSPLANAITGEIVHVDGGFHCVGLS